MAETEQGASATPGDRPAPPPDGGAGLLDVDATG